MSYVVTRSDGTVLTTVLNVKEAVAQNPSDPGYDDSATSIRLVREGNKFYASSIGDDMVHMLENFANALSPNNPLTGQLWYDTSEKKLKLRNLDNDWEQVGSEYALALRNPVNITIDNFNPDGLLTNPYIVSKVVPFDGSVDITIPIEMADVAGLTANTSFSAPTITVDKKGRVIAISAGPTIPTTDGLANANDVVKKAGDTMTGTLVMNGPSANINLTNGAKVKENGNDLLPKGVIVMWSGATAPGGWGICDGTNGTPDLRNRFIMGSGSQSIGSSGGSLNQTVTTTTGGDHIHTGTTASAGGHNHGGVTGSTVLSVNQIPAHKHALGSGVPIKGSGYGYSGSNGVTPGTLTETNETGGGLGHDHSIPSGGDHTHGLTLQSAGAHNHSVTVNTTPPYYVLAFIMKL